MGNRLLNARGATFKKIQLRSVRMKKSKKGNKSKREEKQRDDWQYSTLTFETRDKIGKGTLTDYSHLQTLQKSDTNGERAGQVGA